MKQKIFKSLNNILIFVIILFLLLSIFLVGLFNKLIDDQLYDAIDNEINNMISQQKLTITTSNTNNLNNLKLLANTITKDHLIDDNMQKYLKSQSDYITIHDVYFIGLDGIGVSASGDFSDFSSNPTFLEVVSTKAPASFPNENSELNNGIMDLAVPVIIDGALQGVLLGNNYVNSVFDQIGIDLYGLGYVIILNGEGEAVVSSSEDYISAQALTGPNIEYLNDTSFESIQPSLESGKKCRLHFTIDDVTMIAVLTPLDFGDLILGVVVEEEKMQTGMRNIAGVMTYISIGSAFFFATLALYILISRRNTIREIENAAYYDTLTGLPNLVKLKRDMSLILKENPDKKYAIIKTDVANFKSINEMHGYETGNKVLRAFKQISEMAPEKTLILARTGMDEFIFFAGNNFLENLDASTSFYESHFKQIIPELENHHLSFRYGRYFISPGENDVDDIFSKVNLAHTMAKDKKEYVIWDYDDHYKQKVLQTTDIINKMDNALAAGEFHAFLQPKFNTVTNEIIGAEALVRWIEADNKMIFPGDFIPVFEKNGFIVQIDYFILDSVCQLLQKWLNSGHTPVPISINFSRLHLANFQFVENIIAIVDKYHLPHNLIDIEITETVAIENNSALKAVIEDLHAADFSISMDDFGAGYSSLGSLREFEIDTLKLDRSFVTFIQDNDRGELVIDGVVRLAKSLNMDIIAEGVEEKPQIDFLKSVGCTIVQGYYYAKPMPATEFEEKYILLDK